MKNIVKYLMFAMLTLTYTGMMTSCGGGDHTHSEKHGHTHDHGEDGHSHSHGEEDHDHEHEATHGDAAEYASAYVCPMHCEGSGSDEAGTCPVCKMDYVAHADHVKDGHTH